MEDYATIEMSRGHLLGKLIAVRFDQVAEGACSWKTFIDAVWVHEKGHGDIAV